MNSHKQETGSAHVVIIVILVIALLGTLGFVFWQNFIEKKDASVNNATSTTTPAKSTTSTPTPSTQTALLLPSYGVEVPYSNTDDTYTVTAITDGGNAGSYTVLSKKIADACGDGAFGTIYQVAKGQTKPMSFGTVTLGDHDYIWGGYGNSSCTSNSQVDTVSAVQTAFGNAFKNIKASN